MIKYLILFLFPFTCFAENYFRSVTIESALSLPYLSGSTVGGHLTSVLDTSIVPENGNVYFTNARARLSLSATSPLLFNSSTGTFFEQQANASQAGFLSAADWTTFNGKLDRSSANDIVNPDAAVDTSSWNLYNDAGRTVPAFVVDQDITYTSALSGDAGNGATITYVLGSSPYAEPPLVTCPTGSSVQVSWYNGPTLSQNPTATVLKAAYDATPCAVAIATSAITGTASRRQYITGTVKLGNGGDTSPVDGTGGTVNPAVTFTRTTLAPLEGIGSFDLFKDTNSREGTGVSTDFTIPSLDKGNKLQISFAYSGSSGMILGTSSDVRVFLYDVTNAVLLPITPLETLKGPTGSALIYTGQFTAATNSVLYRLILHMASTSTTAYDLLLDEVVVNDQLIAGEPTQVPSVVLPGQTINGSVTDHMVVMWTDGASQWVPATQAGGANSVFGTDKTMLGFATNIVGLVADIYVNGFMDGFSFGPFVGFNQYIDGTAGGISPLPSPFTDTYVGVGKGVSSTGLNINFSPHRDQIGTKGGLLTNSGVNDGTGDLALAVGANGSYLLANSAAADGISWTAPVGTAPIVYTAASHAFSCTTATDSVTGCLSSTDHTALSANTTARHNAVTIGTANGLSLSTQALSLAAATDSVPGALTAADHTSLTADTTARHNAVTIGTANGLSLSTQAISLAAATDSVPGAMTAADHTTFTGHAPKASPVFTGDVNSSTGNVLISTIGKGLQVKTGTNAKIGTAVLVAGAKIVANSSVTANSIIFLTSQVDGGTVGAVRVSSKTAGTGFTITSLSALDTSTIGWMIVEQIP